MLQIIISQALVFEMIIFAYGLLVYCIHWHFVNIRTDRYSVVAHGKSRGSDEASRGVPHGERADNRGEA